VYYIVSLLNFWANSWLFRPITESLASLHWLCASERIQFKLAMLTLRSLHWLALQYLADDLIRIADMPSRYQFRSVRTRRLEVPRVRLAIIGDRTFRAAGSRLWNSLPSDVIDCQTVVVGWNISFLVFLFLDISLGFVFSLFSCGPWKFFYLGHVKKSIYDRIQYNNCTSASRFVNDSINYNRSWRSSLVFC